MVVMVMMVMVVVEIDSQHDRGAAGAVVVQHGHDNMGVMREMTVIQVPDDI